MKMMIGLVVGVILAIIIGVGSLVGFNSARGAPGSTAVTPQELNPSSLGDAALSADMPESTFGNSDLKGFYQDLAGKVDSSLAQGRSEASEAMMPAQVSGFSRIYQESSESPFKGAEDSLTSPELKDLYNKLLDKSGMLKSDK